MNSQPDWQSEPIGIDATNLYIRLRNRPRRWWRYVYEQIDPQITLDIKLSSRHAHRFVGVRHYIYRQAKPLATRRIPS